ncbi:hypothetical protein J0H58_15350 [bacterium]|jgi:hypothetical protein|nr:hypothetical protein [bacterium]
MPKAYVGVASKQGLAAFQPERDDTLSFVSRCSLACADRVGFWAVLGDSDARRVRALLYGGHQREALRLLDRSARELGRILPGDERRIRVH